MILLKGFEVATISSPSFWTKKMGEILNNSKGKNTNNRERESPNKQVILGITGIRSFYQLSGYLRWTNISSGKVAALLITSYQITYSACSYLLTFDLAAKLSCSPPVSELPKYLRTILHEEHVCREHVWKGFNFIFLIRNSLKLTIDNLESWWATQTPTIGRWKIFGALARVSVHFSQNVLKNPVNKSGVSMITLFTRGFANIRGIETSSRKQYW